MGRQNYFLGLAGAILALGGVGLGWGAGSKEASAPTPDTWQLQEGVHFPLDPEVSDMVGTPSDLELDLVVELGEGDLWFGQIVDLAASSQQRLVAVADQIGCRILLFEFPSGDLVSEMGGCGEGPGEFGMIRSVAFKGDTLLVYDLRRRRIVKLGFDGQELASEIPPLDPTQSPILRRVDAGADWVLFAPTLVRSSRRELLSSQRDGEAVTDGLPDTEISFRYRRPDVGRSVAACAFQGVEAVAAANRWALEAVVLSSALDARFRHVDGASWPPPERRPDPPLAWAPPGGAPRVACSDTLAVWRYRISREQSGGGGTSEELRVDRGFVLVASAAGRLVSRAVVADTAWPHVSAMTPAAGIGDVFFFFSNERGPYPMVRGYRVVLPEDPP